MKISTKGRYAVRIMADLARNCDDYISISEVSQRQNITIKYCEQIIALLSKGGLLESMRGTKGGYKLSKKASEISVREILEVTGDGVKIATCTYDKCDRVQNCDAVGTWVRLTNLINDYLNNIKLSDLIK